MEEQLRFGWEPWNWGFWWICPLFMFIMIIVCIFMMRRSSCTPFGHFMREVSGRPSAVDSAGEILKNRYALGEITKKEYEEMKRDIATQLKRR
jgi:putative membrane protein